MYLSQYHGRDNNFNLLRFIAASLVLFSHSFALSTGSANSEPLRNALGITWAIVAVDLFFVTSGYLVTGSLQVRKNLFEFAAARALRILPGLWVALGLTVFVVGTCATTLGMVEYLTHPETWGYLLKNGSVLKTTYTLPGVFEGLPWKQAVNGSLWTLPLEVRMYGSLAALWFFARFLLGKFARGFSGICLAVAIFAGCAHLYMIAMNGHEENIRLTYMFFAGAAFRMFQGRVYLLSRIAVPMLLTVLLAATNKTAFGMVYSLCIPYLVLYFAFVPDGPIRWFNRVGDYSYGIYIYAFPVQQMLALQWRGINPYEMIFTSFLLSLMLAVGSWALIEKPALALKGRYKGVRQDDGLHAESR